MDNIVNRNTVEWHILLIVRGTSVGIMKVGNAEKGVRLQVLHLLFLSLIQPSTISHSVGAEAVHKRKASMDSPM